MYPELKPDFIKNKVPPRRYQSPQLSHRANMASSSTINSHDHYKQFTANPVDLINKFATFLQKEGRREVADQAVDPEDGNTTALLGKFAGFLEDVDHIPKQEHQGILNAFKSSLNVNLLHDFWIVDSGATDHITNKVSKLKEFEKLNEPSKVSVANGEGAKVVGKGIVHLISDKIQSMVLYVPSFPFQLLSVGKITNTLNCLVIFSPQSVIFQDCITKKTIGEGFYLDGLYYISKNSPSGFQVKSIPNQDNFLWHQCLARPS